MYGAVHLQTNVQSNMIEENSEQEFCIVHVFSGETSDPKSLRLYQNMVFIKYPKFAQWGFSCKNSFETTCKTLIS